VHDYLNVFFMRKYLFYFAALILGAAMLAPQGLSAQQRVVKVQGHPHKVLTEKYGSKEGATTARTAVSTRQVDTTWIDPANVECWIDEPKLNPFEIDSAILIIKFTDGKDIDSVLVWGYRWNRDSTIQHHGIDMLRTVANNDQRLLVLMQYSGLYGHSVGGIGYNLYDDGALCSRPEIDFDIYNAQHDSSDSVWFSYFNPNNYCSEGQVTTPLNANNSVTFSRVDYRRTGILVHPFGAEYGQAAEDFDFWYLTGYIQDRQHWQSGWLKNGFWGYYRADNWRVPVPSSNPDIYVPDPEAADYGITYEPLNHRQVHAFVYRHRIPSSKYDHFYDVRYFDGDMRFMDCGCAPCLQNVTPANVTGKKK
jgi:hypothetical protein